MEIPKSLLINDRESREEGWVYGIRSARPADQIGFSGGAGVTIDCAASLAQVIRGAIELGTSLSSPLRLELAANRTSSGHTVSQNRSRPEDHLTLALARFVQHIVARRTVGGELPRREELERGILGPRSGGGAGQYRTLREPVRALPAFAPHDTRATAAGSGSCAICFHRGPAGRCSAPPDHWSDWRESKGATGTGVYSVHRCAARCFPQAFPLYSSSAQDFCARRWCAVQLCRQGSGPFPGCHPTM